MIEEFLVETGIAPSFLYVLDDGVVRLRVQPDEYLTRRGRWVVETRIRKRNGYGFWEERSYVRLASKAQASRLVRALRKSGYRGCVTRHRKSRAYVTWNTHVFCVSAVAIRRVQPIEVVAS